MQYIQIGESLELGIHINLSIFLLTVTISSDGTAIVSQNLMMARSIMLQICISAVYTIKVALGLHR